MRCRNVDFIPVNFESHPRPREAFQIVLPIKTVAREIDRVCKEPRTKSDRHPLRTAKPFDVPFHKVRRCNSFSNRCLWFQQRLRLGAVRGGYGDRCAAISTV